MAYDFTCDEFARVWESFNTHADPETHFLSIALLHQAMLGIVDNVNSHDDVTWFIRHINAIDTGKVSFIKFVKGVGDLIDHKYSQRKKRPDYGKRFTWREIAELFRLFMSIDVDKSGEISFSELYKALRYINPRAKVNDALAMFSVLDVDKTNSIDFAEFVKGISLAGEAHADPTILTHAENIPAPHLARSKSKSPSKAEMRQSHPMQLEREVYRSVEGSAYALDMSSSHFPKRLPGTSGSFEMGFVKTDKAADKKRIVRSHTTDDVSKTVSRTRPGTRLYSSWAEKNAKPASILDHRVPSAVSPTKPSFFPAPTGAPRSTSPTVLPPPSQSPPPGRFLPQMNGTKTVG